MTRSLSAIGSLLSLIALTAVALVTGSANSDPAHGPQWRGPFFIRRALVRRSDYAIWVHGVG
jgi:hypothetical protein